MATIAYDELPTVRASRLRASRHIRPNDTSTEIYFPDAPDDALQTVFTVGVQHVRFPNGGSWSYLVCPTCGRRGKTLRLYQSTPRCQPCLSAAGLRPRVQLIRTHLRLAHHAPRILALLNSPTPVRKTRPHRWLERRDRLEARLNRHIIVAREHAITEHDIELAKLNRK